MTELDLDKHHHLWNCYEVPYCVKCGHFSPLAKAIREGHFNPQLHTEWVQEFPDKEPPPFIGWCCQQHYAEYVRANVCRVSDDEWSKEQKERRDSGEGTVSCSQQAARRMLLQTQS